MPRIGQIVQFFKKIPGEYSNSHNKLPAFVVAMNIDLTKIQFKMRQIADFLKKIPGEHVPVPLTYS